MAHRCDPCTWETGTEDLLIVDISLGYSKTLPQHTQTQIACGGGYLYNPSTWKVKARGSGVQSQPGLHENLSMGLGNKARKQR